MRPASPQATLVHQTPKERASEKISHVCAWLGLFGHSTEAVLRNLLEIKASGICSRLEDAGLLLRVPIPGASACAWALTAAGVRRAELALQRRVDYLSHPSRLSLARFAHDLAVQREVIARLKTDLPTLRHMRGDRELQRVPAAIRPDVVVRHMGENGEEVVVCLEVELSSKSTAELRRKLELILCSLKPDTRWFWYVSEGPAARSRYESTWRRVVEDDGHGRGLSIPWLHQACRFELAIGTDSHPT